MKQKLLMAIMCFCLFSWANAQESFNGIGSGMGNLFRLSDAKRVLSVLKISQVKR